MQQILLGICEREAKTELFVTLDIDEAIFHGDVVNVMSARVSRFIDRIEVGLQRPRCYDIVTSQAFIDVKRRVQANLHKDANDTCSRRC